LSDRAQAATSDVVSTFDGHTLEDDVFQAQAALGLSKGIGDNIL